MEPQSLLAFRDANRTIDVTDLLSRVSAPTLITHRLEDDFTPLSFARKFASPTPTGKLVTVHSVGGPFLATQTEAGGDPEVSWRQHE